MASSLRIVLGSEDPVCPLRLAQSFNDVFEGSTLRAVEKVGHYLPLPKLTSNISGPGVVNSIPSLFPT